MTRQSIPSHAEPAMIVWCRERARASVEDVADRLSLADSDVMFWEMGERTPTLVQLKALAKFLRFPAAVFYLAKPPAWHPINDFRRVPEAEKGKFSRELAFWTRMAQGRMEWLAEYLKSQDQEPLGFVGATKLTDRPSEVGERLRNIVGVSLSEQNGAHDKRDAFNLWRAGCERAGVAVFLTRKVQISEMRGFAIANPIAPVVAVNDQDQPGGRIFTLMHEMTHILLGLSGVSEIIADDSAATPDERVEVFCNVVAAETLVPSDDFRERMSEFSDDPQRAIVGLSESYKVSQEVIARRLFDLRFITREHYRKLIAEIRSIGIAAAKKTKKEIKIKQARKVLSTVGRHFGRAIVSAYRDEEITGSDASDLLDMKAQFLPEFENELRNRP